jgi:hypothetical protein
MHNSTGRRWAWLPLALVVAASGCEPGVSPEVQAQLAMLDSLAAQRDSLFNEVADNARLLNELGTELDKVEGIRGLDSAAGESPVSAQRGALRHKVQQVTARLAESEKRLVTSRNQLDRARRETDTLKTRSGLEQMVKGSRSDRRVTITLTSLTGGRPPWDREHRPQGHGDQHDHAPEHGLLHRRHQGRAAGARDHREGRGRAGAVHLRQGR